MDLIRIVCRESKLSMMQAEIVKSKILALHPHKSVTITGIKSQGDKLIDVPFSQIEGMDFFTLDIYEALRSGNADIAVHSLKDMSSEHFFSHDGFAVVDRELSHDVFIANANIMKALANGDEISIGTSSPRREAMVIPFLEKALPNVGHQIRLVVKSIRGNVETRLGKLHNGEFDAIILATAGLNRLLRHHEHGKLIARYLNDKKMMILPLIECTPAPCQGLIVAECISQNIELKTLLTDINHAQDMQEAI
ncbi:MAG: hydroxymethylbilane synthase, partial [Saprospiraceae bacterium]